MKILIINPNSSESLTAAIQKTAEDFLWEEIHIVCKSTPNAPHFIETYEDITNAAPGMVQLVRKNEADFDAFIVGCHYDPNLDCMKEITEKPVVGIGEASIKMASMLGHRFSIITTDTHSIPIHEDLVRKYHFQDVLASVRAPGEEWADSEEDEKYLTVNYGGIIPITHSDYSMLRINEERLRVRFKELSLIGATSDGGIHRPAFSEAHLEARRWFLEQARQAGLETQIDDAGNHSAVLRCDSEEGPTLLLGSHLDSVPYGGRFDGALGVLATLEVLQVVKENKFPLITHLEAIDFTGYLELHVEQSNRLFDQGISIGVVTSIGGIRSFKIRFIGSADHAGTTAMNQRLDAAQGASAFTLAVRELVMKDFPGWEDCVHGANVLLHTTLMLALK